MPDPKIDTRPAHPTHINLPELKNILGKAIRHPDLRDRLLSDPEKTLREMNYIPSPEAVDFIKSLSTKSFKEVAGTFKPHDPKDGMAEA